MLLLIMAKSCFFSLQVVSFVFGLLFGEQVSSDCFSFPVLCVHGMDYVLKCAVIAHQRRH